jgi:hypothetical protein
MLDFFKRLFPGFQVPFLACLERSKRYKEPLMLLAFFRDGLNTVIIFFAVFSAKSKRINNVFHIY